MANGILIVDKPEGWTSHDVVARLRGALHERRSGHGGTLDPLATGVLPVFVGRATRAVEFFESAEKEYETTLRLGLCTDTDDITGAVLEKRPVQVTQAQLLAILPGFLGAQEQLPPMYSAVKIGGKKLYELARAGREVERTPRKITIYTLDLLAFDGTDARLRVRCSKGTYIRTLCHDIGAALGCGGTMAALRRTQAGVFTLQHALPLHEILAHPDPASLLLPVDTLFAAYPAEQVSGEALRRCRNGNPYPSPGPDGFCRVYAGEEFLLLGRRAEGVMHTVKSFFEVK